MSNFIEVKKYFDHFFLISFSCQDTFYNERISNVFPDEDFCIYKDFPFNQLVLIYQFFQSYKEDKMKILNSKLSCTYLLLTQYYNV